MKRVLAVILGLVLLMQIQSPVVPMLCVHAKESTEETAEEAQDAPQVSAPSAILMEASTGTVLYEKDAHTTRPPASVTKVMTMLLLWIRC